MTNALGLGEICPLWRWSMFMNIPVPHQQRSQPLSINISNFMCTDGVEETDYCRWQSACQQRLEFKVTDRWAPVNQGGPRKTQTVWQEMINSDEDGHKVTSTAGPTSKVCAEFIFWTSACNIKHWNCACVTILFLLCVYCWLLFDPFPVVCSFGFLLVKQVFLVWLVSVSWFSLYPAASPPQSNKVNTNKATTQNLPKHKLNAQRQTKILENKQTHQTWEPQQRWDRISCRMNSLDYWTHTFTTQ